MIIIVLWLQSHRLLQSSPSPVLLDIAEFALFSRLIIEIRLKTWELASQVRHLVEIRFPKHHLSRQHHFVRGFPAILHKSRESREDALKYYEIAFTAKYTIHPVHIDFKLAVIHLRRNSAYWNAAQMNEFVDYLPRREKVEILAPTAHPE